MAFKVFNSNILKAHPTSTSIYKNRSLPHSPPILLSAKTYEGFRTLKMPESKLYVGAFNCMACVYIFQCKNKNIIVRYKTIPKEKKRKSLKLTNSMFVSQDVGQHQGYISDSSYPLISYILPDFPLDHSPSSL